MTSDEPEAAPPRESSEKSDEPRHFAVTQLGLWLLLAVIIGLVYFYGELNQSGNLVDFPAHTEAVKRVLAGGTPPPHFLFHLTSAGVHIALTKTASILDQPAPTVSTAAKVTIMFAYIVFAILLERLLFNATLLKGMRVWTRVLLILTVMLVWPAELFWWYSGYYDTQYIGLNTLHNPTVIFLRPFALSHLFMVARIFAQPVHSKTAIGLGVLTILTGLAKPNYLMCMLPALVALHGYYWLRKDRRFWAGVGQQLFLSVIIPGGLVLAWQFFSTFVFGAHSEETGATNGIAIGFVVRYMNWEQILFIVPKLVCSILFPLVVILLYRSKIELQMQSGRLITLSALMLFFGYIQVMFLRETGPRAFHGNFGWGAQISNLMLYVCCASFLATEQSKSESTDEFLRYSWFTHALHVAFGVIYFDKLFWRR